MIREGRQSEVQSPTLRENLLSPGELATILGLAEATLADWRSQGRGPAYAKVGRRIWYLRNRVESWIQSPGAGDKQWH